MVGSLIYAVPSGGKCFVLLSQTGPQLYPVPGQQSKVLRSVGADCQVHTQLCPVVVEESQSLFLCLSIGVPLIIPASQSYCESNEQMHAKASSCYCYCCNYFRSQAPAQSHAFCALPYVFRLSHLSSLTHPVDVRVSALGTSLVPSWNLLQQLPQRPGSGIRAGATCGQSHPQGSSHLFMKRSLTSSLAFKVGIDPLSISSHTSGQLRLFSTS